MFTFDFDSLVDYGFPNPDYFDFYGDTLVYGYYGGQDYSAGQIDGTITLTSADPVPVDAYDQAFYDHDWVAQTSSDPDVLLQSHIDVVQDVTTLLVNAFSAYVSDWC